MTTLDDSQTSGLWGSLELDAPLSNKFSDVINDDFLIVDGLNEDLSGVLDIDAGIFSESKADFSFEAPNPSDDADDDDDVSAIEEKVKTTREDRSRPPTPKRRRSVSPMTAPISPMDISPHPVKSMASTDTTSLKDLQRQYQAAVDQLAVSMRRSEMTRSEIISFRKAAETRSQLEKAQTAQYSNADRFLTGTRSTLTVGLEQSRQMLRGYMGVLKGPPF